jgi:hypothetical protein
MSDHKDDTVLKKTMSNMVNTLKNKIKSVLKRGYIYSCSTKTQERLGKLSLMTIGNKILHDLENSSNFCVSVRDIFTENNCA